MNATIGNPLNVITIASIAALFAVLTFWKPNDELENSLIQTQKTSEVESSSTSKGHLKRINSELGRGIFISSSGARDVTTDYSEEVEVLDQSWKDNFESLSEQEQIDLLSQELENRSSKDFDERLAIFEAALSGFHGDLESLVPLLENEFSSFSSLPLEEQEEQAEYLAIMSKLILQDPQKHKEFISKWIKEEELNAFFY